MGGVVSKIEAQVRRRDRVSVYLDGVYAFSVQTLVATAAHLAPGMPLTNEHIAALCSDDSYHKALDRALRYLSYRPRSSKEMNQYLNRLQLDPGTTSKVLTRLTDLGFLDDLAFAQFWQENRLARDPRGARLIKAELRGKGVDSDTIAALELDSLDEEGNALQAAQRKALSLKGLDEITFRRRLSAFLMRRGYNYDTCAAIVRRLYVPIPPPE